MAVQFYHFGMYHYCLQLFLAPLPDVDFGTKVLSTVDPYTRNTIPPKFYLAKHNPAGTVTWVADIHTKDGGTWPEVDSKFIETDKQGNLYLSGMEKGKCFLAKLPAIQSIHEGAHQLWW